MGQIRTDVDELSLEQREMLSSLCARNHPAEVGFVTDQDARRYARTRFLAETGEGLLIDQPTEKGTPLLLRPGDEVAIYYLLDDGRYAFKSAVTRREMFELRGRRRVPALRLRYPDQIHKAQRRDNYRLSVAHLPSSNSVRIMTTSDEAVRLEGSLVNVSAGGASLVFPEADAGRRFKVDDTLIVELNLPDTLSDYPMLSRVVRLEREPAEQRLRMGVAWMLDGEESEGRQVYDSIAKFVHREQQRRLQREVERKSRFG